MITDGAGARVKLAGRASLERFRKGREERPEVILAAHLDFHHENNLLAAGKQLLVAQEKNEEFAEDVSTATSARLP